MGPHNRLVACALLLAAALPSAANAVTAAAAVSADVAVAAFPGAVGWAADTPGGRGGALIRVTTLAADGPGSLREALTTAGARTIVFEVGGVIDLARDNLVVREPFVTIAGQTAPSPGITLIKGGLVIASHDVVVRHLRIRPGEAGAPKASGWEVDAISTRSAYDVIVDHCSLTWATDEVLSASGPRFTGDTPEEWRAGTSHRLTFSHNIVAEALAYSTHSKIEHSKGSLIHDNVTELLIYANLYAHNYERNPLLKGGVSAAVVNNFIYDPGARVVHYNLMAAEWGAVPFAVGELSLVGNVIRAGPSTRDDVAMFLIGGDGDIEYYAKDNIAIDRIGRPLPLIGRYTTSDARIIDVQSPPVWPEGLKAMPAGTVERAVLEHVGARPWDRDAHDVRLLADVAEGRGRIIDSEQDVGGYPEMPETRRAFEPDRWNLATMTPKDRSILDSSHAAPGT